MLYHRNQPSRVNLKEMLSIAFIKQLEVAASGFSVLGYPGEITCPKFCPWFLRPVSIKCPCLSKDGISLIRDYGFKWSELLTFIVTCVSERCKYVFTSTINHTFLTNRNGNFVFLSSCDARSYERNLCNCVRKPENFRSSTGFEPVTSRYRCDALTELWNHWRWELVIFGF